MKELSKNRRSFKEQMQYVLLWLFFIWVSCLCAVLIDLLLVKIVTTIVSVSYPVRAVLHVIFYLLGASAPIAAISYLISYHLGSFSLGNSLLEGLLASVLHLLAGILLVFPSWITGGVRWLAGLFEYGNRLYGADTMQDITLTNYLVAFAIFAVFYTAMKTVFALIGKSVRIRHRIALTGSPADPCAE